MGNGMLNRRDFLRIGAAAATGAVVAGCVQMPAATSDGEMAEPDEVPREVRLTGHNRPIYHEMNEKFTEETGIEVAMEFHPPKWEEILAKFTLWGESGYDGIDVEAQDDQIASLYSFKRWCFDLSHLMTDEERADQADAVLGLTEQVGGFQARMFFFVGAEPFYFNKELIPEAPKTWEEMVEVAKTVTDPENDVWGWRPNAGSHNMNLTLMMVNHAGGNNETLDDEGTLTALQFMRDWVFEYEITPPTVVSEAAEEIMALAPAGKAGMWWMYEGNYGPLLEVEGGMLTPETLGVSRWPMGPSSDELMVHAWGWLIPVYTPRKELAEEFVSWMTQYDNIKWLITDLQITPPRKSMYNDPEVTDKIPILRAGPGWEELTRGAKFRCPVVCHPNAGALSLIFQDAGLFVMAGERSPEEVRDWAANEIAIAMDA